MERYHVQNNGGKVPPEQRRQLIVEHSNIDKVSP